MKNQGRLLTIIISSLFLITSTGLFSQTTMPAAIKITPANATAWDQLTITFDPAKACAAAGASLVGAPVVKMHAAAFLYSNLSAWGTSWGQLGINYDAVPKDGIHKTTDLKANGDGTWSITMVPAKYFGASEGTVLIGITAVFNGGDWTKEGKDGTGTCHDFYIPLKYKDPLNQATKAFNYQGVARDQAGLLMANRAIRIKLSILQGTETGTSVYSESQAVTTNPFGLFNLKVGKGTVLSGNFASIDWSTGAYFLKSEMDPNGGTSYQALGVSQLLSVPYALYAENAGVVDLSWANSSNGMTTLDQVGIGTNAPTGMLSVQGSYAIPSDTALFSVKDKNGQVIFAVYEDGAELFVKDGAKGGRGGFAVSGRTSSKGVPTSDLMRVTPDSVRIYVNDIPTSKGGRGGFAVGGRTPGKGISASFTALTRDNYFIGDKSGSKITSGLYNSALGYESGVNISQGSSNAFLGYQSGYSNNMGSGNLFLGYQSGYSNQSGNINSFLGYQSGYSNTSGINNTFLGGYTGYHNSTGSFNTFVGDSAGYFNTYGNSNTFLGTKTGLHNTTGTNNVFIGNLSGYNNADGGNNFFMGNMAGFHSKEGWENVFIGNESGFMASSSWGNVYLGYLSGHQTTKGGANTYLGARTGYSTTIGFSNTFIGIEAGYTLDSGCCNTFLGDHAGYLPVYCQENILLGAYAGYHDNKSTTNSGKNVIIGNYAGFNSINGWSNVFIGTNAAHQNVESSGNVFLGYQSGFNNKTGGSNVLIGNNSGYSNTTGFVNVMIGNEAGFSNSTGYENVFIGNQSGKSSIDAIGNVFIGTYSGANNAHGQSNVFIGLHAGQKSVNGSSNTVVGAWSAVDDSIGNDNVIIGCSVARNSIGKDNVFIGNYSASNITTGSGNVFIGKGAGWNETTGSNKLFIDNSGTPTPLIWGDFSNRQLVINGNAANGKVFFVNGTAGGTSTWAQVSDARMKKNILPLTNALEKLMQLQGVSYEWKDPEHYETGEQIGFIAQDVEKVIPEVVRVNNGNYMMQYSPVVALVVEAMKEQQKEIKGLSEQNELLRKQNEELLKRLDSMEQKLNR